jgi:hypothetical protein
MARIPQLIPFCEEHGLVLTSIADLIEYIKELQGASATDGAQSAASSSADFSAMPPQEARAAA